MDMFLGTINDPYLRPRLIAPQCAAHVREMQGDHRERCRSRGLHLRSGATWCSLGLAAKWYKYTPWMGASLFPAVFPVDAAGCSSLAATTAMFIFSSFWHANGNHPNYTLSFCIKIPISKVFKKKIIKKLNKNHVLKNAKSLKEWK
jgi:hypothetical protein